MENDPVLVSRRRFHTITGAAIAATAAATLSGCASSGTAMGGGMGGTSAAGLDWFDVVKTEHRAVDALFAQLLKTTDADLAQRDMLRNKIGDALTNHAIEEENVLYPALMMAGVTAEAEALYREHAQVKVILAELDVMPKNHPGWLARARQLQAMVQKHVADEETRVYPGFRARMSPEQNAMVTRMYLREGAKYTAA